MQLKEGSSQERMLNFLIKNNNKFDIQKNTLSILIKNQYDLNVTIKDELLFNDLKAGMEIPIGLYIRSNAKNLLKKYCLRIEVVSNNLDILSKPIDLKIEVKDDQDKLVEFKKMMWENANSFDEGESIQVMAATQMEAEKVFQMELFNNLWKL